MNLITNILGGILTFIGLLAFLGFCNNARMIQQDPMPSDEDKKAGVVMFLISVVLVGVGIILIIAL